MGLHAPQGQKSVALWRAQWEAVPFQERRKEAVYKRGRSERTGGDKIGGGSWGGGKDERRGGGLRINFHGKLH